MEHTIDSTGKALAAALGVDEYILREVQRRSATIRKTMGLEEERQQSEESRISVRLFSDHKNGRGQSEFYVQSQSLLGQTLETQVRNAQQRASQSFGPSWQLPLPLAPARVQLEAPQWLGPPMDVIAGQHALLVSQLPPGMRILHVELRFCHERIRVALSNGFDNQYKHTHMTLSAIVQAEKGSPVSVRWRGRRPQDLVLAPGLEDAKQRSRSQRGSVLLSLGKPVDVIFLSRGYLPLREDDFGIWTPLVRQSAVGMVNRGLAKYQPGQAITAVPLRGEKLELSSDGTVDFGLQSAPFGFDGAPVRRFTLVSGGRSAGLAVDLQGAGLTGADPNGGVRNLVIAPGTVPMAQLRARKSRPVLVVEHIDRMESLGRGRVCLQIGSGTLDGKPVRTTVVGDVYQWLTEAQYAKETEDRGWLRGPVGIRFNNIVL